MTHFGIICLEGTGHLNPMTSLGYELQRRGHRVTLFGVLDAEPNAQVAELSFRAIGESEFPLGKTAELMAESGEMSGLAALKHNFKSAVQNVVVCLRDSPKAIRAAGVEALLIDQVSLGAGTIAEILGIPFVSICSALPLNLEDSVPPIFTSWQYNPALWARLRNKAGYALAIRIAKPVREVIDEYRKQNKLPPYLSGNDGFSDLAQLSQQPPEFEFPRTALPKVFHFTGPYSDHASRKIVPFAFEELTGQPLIYASMGTIQNRLIRVFENIAEACVGLDVQLVISLGGSSSPDSLQNLPGAPLVVKYAPQLELLKKATLTITHAGLNTSLESLSNAVPMVAIPIASDQPGVAARIA